MYAGDIGDGIPTLFTFWLVVPYFLGIADAVQETRVQNAKYTIKFYEKENFEFGEKSKLKDEKPQSLNSSPFSGGLHVSK